ncbi:MAG: TIGR04255 family protein [Solirubrobacteraceae bacterium]|jgi:uncharacterized protein (TIGR04255 family)
MPLALPDQPRRFYRTNPLRLVVCQVRFPVLHRFDEPGTLARFQDVLKDRYPRSAPEQQLAITVGPSGPVSGPPATSLWRFQGMEDGWSVAISRDFVSLETTAYERYEDLRDRLAEVLDATLALGVTVRERLGLRYVDEIRHPDAKRPGDWRRLIEEKLLGMVGGEELGDDVVQALQEIRLREQDGTVAIRHGYLGREATGQDPFYLLDVDYFDERSVPLLADQVLGQIDSYHRTIHNLFETAITEELRGHLGVKEQAHA